MTFAEEMRRDEEILRRKVLAMRGRQGMRPEEAEEACRLATESKERQDALERVNPLTS